MTKDELKQFILESIKNNLSEILQSEKLMLLESNEQEKDYCLALIHKISHDLPLTKDEAYYLTRSVPPKEPVYTQIKEEYVYPYLSEAEIYRRDLAEGDEDTLLDIINDIKAQKISTSKTKRCSGDMK